MKSKIDHKRMRRGRGIGDSKKKNNIKSNLKDQQLLNINKNQTRIISKKGHWGFLRTQWIKGGHYKTRRTMQKEKGS